MWGNGVYLQSVHEAPYPDGMSVAYDLVSFGACIYMWLRKWQTVYLFVCLFIIILVFSFVVVFFFQNTIIASRKVTSRVVRIKFGSNSLVFYGISLVYKKYTLLFTKSLNVFGHLRFTCCYFGKQNAKKKKKKKAIRNYAYCKKQTFNTYILDFFCYNYKTEI